MSLYKVGDTYYLYIRHQGERIRRSCGTSNRAHAQKIHDQVKADLWQQKRDGKSWLDACAAWLQAAPRSKSDVYSLHALNYDDRPLESCTVESFSEALKDKSPGTYNRYRSIINAILNLAKSSGWIDKPSVLSARKQKTKGFRFLTEAEWKRLYAALPPHLKAPARFSIATGLRQKNVFFLSWSRIDIQRRIAWVQPEDSKSNKPIGVPLSDEALDVLRGQIGQHEEWVFPYKGKGRAAGRPIGKIKTAWNNARRRAGLGEWVGEGDARKFEPNFRWHDFRHTFASWHAMSGTPLEVLQKLGGWSDMRMVMKYAHLSPSYIAQFTNNAKPFKTAESAMA